MTDSRAPMPEPRRFTATFDASIPKAWCGGDAALTAILNTYTLLAPGNEGYIVRTLKECAPRIADPALRATIERFSQQEGQHGAAHHRFLAVLQAQGYRTGRFQAAVVAMLYRFMEPLLSLELRLAKVACTEHVNAYFGGDFLALDLLRDADPSVRALYEWHFAEEIEHKAVAFDALQAISGRYWLRIAGAILVLPTFYTLMTVGTLSLLRQDRLLRRRATWAQLRRHLFGRDHMVRRAFAHMADYLRPGFHPTQRDDFALARRTIARHAGGDAPALHPIATPVERAHGGDPAWHDERETSAV